MGTTYSKNAISRTRETISVDLAERLRHFTDVKRTENRGLKNKPSYAGALRRQTHEKLLVHTLKNMGGIAEYDDLAREMDIEKSRVARAVRLLALRGEIEFVTDASDSWVIKLPITDGLEDSLRMETPMDDELRNALKELEAENTIDRDNGEFTIKESIGIWTDTYSGTVKKANKLTEQGKLTMRRAYDPEVKQIVNAYKQI